MNDMTTPIADFVKKYASSDVSRFHMPGHKGKSFLGYEAFDITEINGADVLGAPNGIIEESELNATRLFGTAHTFYSTEGSTLSIKAMLAIIKKLKGNGQVKILAARNVHKAFVYACALLDIEAKWLYSKNFDHICSCNITAEELDAQLKISIPDAVYVTSPDYLGNILDIGSLANVCHKHGVPLLVDNAHGAYLAFLEQSEHPIALGADMCCDSAHKTLPVLTGGAYLHISKNFPNFSCDEVRSVISLFASTSPSYLILQSLDICNAYIENGYRERLNEFVKKVRSIKLHLAERNFLRFDDNREELKIVISKQKSSYSGYELADVLSKFSIEPEFYDEDNLVLMLSPELSDNDLKKLLNAFSSLSVRTVTIKEVSTPVCKPEQKISMRDAIFTTTEIIPTKKALGRICAAPTVSCPPAVPIVISGELIGSAEFELLLKHGIKSIEVVK